jgi:hypothetical protein
MRGVGRLAAVLLSAVLAVSVLAGATAAAGTATGAVPTGGATDSEERVDHGPTAPALPLGASIEGVGPGAGPSRAEVRDSPSPRQLEGIDADGVRLRIEVAPDGDANWTIEYRVQLGEANQTAAFESLQTDIRANSTAYRDRFSRRMARTAGTAANATGREMAIENVTVDARMQSVPEEFGFVTYRFEWTNFAAVEGDRLVVGDALAGLFLDRGTSLVVAWPSGYEAVDVRPGPPDQRFNSRVVWSGPTDFGSNEPRVIVEPARQGGLPVGGAPIALVAVLALVAVVGAVWWRRGDGTVGNGGPATPTDGGGHGTDGSEGAADGTGTATGRSPSAGPASAADGGTTDGADAGGSASTGAGPTRAGDGTPGGTAAPATDPGGDEGAAASTSASTSATGPGADESVDDATTEGQGETSGEGASSATDADDDDEADADGDEEADDDDQDRVPMELLSPEERVMRLVTDRGGRIKQQEVVSELDWSAARTSQVVGSLRESGDIETFRLGRENVLKLPEEDG